MGVTRNALTVGAMTGLSRLAGFLREILMANFFGTGIAKSAFDIAFRIPNLFRRLFGEGALSSAFIPVYTETLHNDEKVRGAAALLAQRTAGLLVSILGVITALGIIITFPVQAALDPASRWVAILPLLRIMLPYAPFICLAALVMGILNSHRKFAIPALAPIFLNLIWIVALLLLRPLGLVEDFPKIRFVAWAVLIAGAAQVIFQLPALARCGVTLRVRFDFLRDQNVRRVIKLTLPMLIGAGVTQINVCLDGLLALAASPHAPAALEYAERLVYLPLGVIGTAFGTALLPAFSHSASSNNRAAIAPTLRRAIRNILAVMIPAALGLALLAYPLVSLIYKRGAFDALSLQFTARALIAYAPGLPLFSIHKALTPAFYALQDTRTPMRIGIIAVVCNLAMNICSVCFLSSEWAHAGIALSTSLSSAINCALLAITLKKKLLQ